MAVAQLPAPAIILPRRYVGALSSPAQAPNLAWLPLVGVLLGIASLFYVAQTGDLTLTGYNIQEMQTEVSDWEMKNEQATLELSKARALTRVESEARGRMLMVPARDAVFLKAVAVVPDRYVGSSRGDGRATTPALEKPVAPVADPLDPVRSSVSLLIPRAQPPQR